MTKQEQVEKLYRQGKKPKEIVALTGISYWYIRNIIYNIKNPGVLQATMKRYHQNDKGRAMLVRINKSTTSRHQNATLPKAHNHQQRWTQAEIEYLQKHGQEETIHEIALKLGRSYIATKAAGQTFGINLRGNKMGKEANRFRGIYNSLTDPHLKSAPA